MRERIKLTVLIDLDPVPGMFNTAESAHRSVLQLFKTCMPHYNPEVFFESYESPKKYMDQAIQIQKQMLDAGGMFFMNPEARLGWFCVRSDDPEKMDLFLPAYIFRKCFRWVSKDYDQYPYNFSFVEEIT